MLRAAFLFAVPFSLEPAPPWRASLDGWRRPAQARWLRRHPAKRPPSPMTAVADQSA